MDINCLLETVTKHGGLHFPTSPLSRLTDFWSAAELRRRDSLVILPVLE